MVIPDLVSFSPSYIKPLSQVLMYAFKLSQLLHQSTCKFVFLSIHSNNCTWVTTDPISWPLHTSAPQSGGYACIQMITPVSPVDPLIDILEFSFKLLHLHPTWIAHWGCVCIQIVTKASLVSQRTIDILEYSFKLSCLAPTWPSQLTSIMNHLNHSGCYVYIQIITHASLTSPHFHILGYSFKLLHLVPTWSTHLTSNMNEPIHWGCMYSSYHACFTTQPTYWYSCIFIQIIAPISYLIQSVDPLHKSSHSVRWLCIQIITPVSLGNPHFHILEFSFWWLIQSSDAHNRSIHPVRLLCILSNYHTCFTSTHSFIVLVIHSYYCDEWLLESKYL